MATQSQRQADVRALLLLSIVPLAVLILSFVFVQLFVSFEADPEYSYLLNGIDLLILRTPAQWDHPGTTVQLLFAILVGVIGTLRAPFTGQWPIADALQNPELYLHAFNSCAAILAAAAVFWFGSRLRTISGSMIAALIGQLSILMAYPIMLSLAHATPETLLIPLTVFLATVVTPTVLGDGKSNPSRGDVAAFGILLGACLATKASAISLVLTAFYYRSLKTQLTALAFAAAGLVFFTLPIRSHYGDMLGYLRDIATHTGVHGSGAEGVPSLATLLDRLLMLSDVLPIAFVSIGLCSTILVGRRFVGKRENDVPDRTFVVSSAVIALQLLLVAKHPGAHYLVPVVAIVALTNAAVAALLLRLQGILWIGAVTVCGVLIATGLYSNAVVTTGWIVGEHKDRSADHDLLAKARASGCQIVAYYDSPMPEFKLMFGSNFAGGHYAQRLQALYPNFLAYDISSTPTFRDFVSDLTLEEASARMAKAPCVYLFGSPLERFEYPINFPMDYLVPIDRAGYNGGDVLFELRRLPDGTNMAAREAQRQGTDAREHDRLSLK